MSITVVCTDVRPAADDRNGCVVVASQDQRESERVIDHLISPNLDDVRERLHAQGIVLGAPLPPAETAGSQGARPSPFQVIAHDEHGEEHRLMVRHSKEYSLSSGSTLYYFSVAAAPGDCRWLIGRNLQIVELSLATGEPGGLPDGSREGGFSEFHGSARGGG